MLFLINNPWLLLITTLVVVFLFFVIRTIIRETSLNSTLHQRQQAMRIPIPLNTGFKKRIAYLTSTALAPIVVIALVFTFSLSSDPIDVGNIQGLQSGDDILSIYDQFQERMETYQVFTGFRTMEEDVVDFEPSMEFDGAEAPENDVNGDQGSDDYSLTNNQVQGVDEMDDVVTDGKYLYIMHNNEVYIETAYTQSLGVSALDHYKTIEYINEETHCPSGMYVTGLYVDDDYLVVIGSQYEYNCEPNDGENPTYEEEYYDYWYGYNNNVVVYVYDKHNEFALVNEYELTGNLIGTRKIGENVYVVTTTYLPLDENDVNVDEYLPTCSVNENDFITKYDDIVYVDGTSPNSFTTFYALNIENEDVDMETILGDNGYNLYVSNQNMYLVGNIYYFEPLTDIIDMEDPVAETKTAVQKIAIDGTDLEYVTTGTVSGTTLNQFSMDEYNGYLRIATTTGWWGDDINNRVYILDENLDEVSKLEHLGKPGETIKSVRFTGDFGYVVTFEQTDPFYVLNLLDTEAPFVEGELLIPGFSTYLQPLGNDFMLGIGFGDNSGGTNGLKISVYDIRDKTNPTIFSEVIFDYEDHGWGFSNAIYNHKDLLVSLDKGIIALPFSISNWSESLGYQYNSGILVYEFNDVLGLTNSGFITHEQNADEEVYVYKIKFIDQYFYTVSNKYVQASTIDEPETMVESITLP